MPAETGDQRPRDDHEPGAAAPERPALFREQALRHHGEAREFGRIVRRPPRWTRIAFPLVVAIALAGVVYLAFGRVTHEARGPAVVSPEDGGEGARLEVTACLPAAFLPQLRPGLPLRLEIDAAPGAQAETTVESVDDRALSPEEARRVLGEDLLRGVRLPRAGVVLARASIAAGELPPLPEPGAARASVEVRLGSERLIFSLFPGLRAAVADEP